MTHLTERATDGASWALDWAAWLVGATLTLAALALVLASVIWLVAHLYLATSTKLEVAKVNRRTRQGA